VEALAEVLPGLLGVGVLESLRGALSPPRQAKPAGKNTNPSAGGVVLFCPTEAGPLRWNSSPIPWAQRKPAVWT
jgi:hypothetical protein